MIDSLDRRRELRNWPESECRSMLSQHQTLIDCEAVTAPTWGPMNTRYLLSGLSPPIRKELGPICCSKYSLARITLFTRRLVSSGLYGEKPSGEGALRGGVILPLWNFTVF